MFSSTREYRLHAIVSIFPTKFIYPLTIFEALTSSAHVLCLCFQDIHSISL